jgi:DNA (cytosine-5)-methyltransferase 1
VAGLFAGIGGFEVGLERAGHRSRLLCEIDPAARSVLQRHFPNCVLATDVKEVDELIEAIPSCVNLLTAGFPCQDLSQAGATRGIDSARSGLISHVFALLDRRRLPWVIIENVPFMLRLNGGDAMARIVSRLERMGYRWAYRVVDSRAFGVPQRRERVFLVASFDSDPREVLLSDDDQPCLSETLLGRLAHGFYWTEGTRGLGWAIDAVPTLKGGSAVGIPSPPAILMPDLSVVTPEIRDAERMQGFEPNWTVGAEKISRKSVRWRLIGNAVTVDVAAWLGLRLAEPGNYDGSSDDSLVPGAPWPLAAWYDGKKRAISRVSRYPIWAERKHLHEFMQHNCVLLRARATEGFLSRATASRLRFADGFLEAVRRHYERVSGCPWSADATHEPAT